MVDEAKVLNERAIRNLKKLKNDEDAALEKAIKENRFEYKEDVNNIEYIDEITEEEYNEWK